MKITLIRVQKTTTARFDSWEDLAEYLKKVDPSFWLHNTFEIVVSEDSRIGD